jgi:hypothetical protein
MREHSPAKNIHVPRTLDEVPEKVAQSKGLQHTATTRIFPNAFLPVFSPANSFALFIIKDDIQRHDAYYDALEKAHDMYIPIYARPLVEGVVFFRHEIAG